MFYHWQKKDIQIGYSAKNRERLRKKKVIIPKRPFRKAKKKKSLSKTRWLMLRYMLPFLWVYPSCCISLQGQHKLPQCHLEQEKTTHLYDISSNPNENGKGKKPNEKPLKAAGLSNNIFSAKAHMQLAANAGKQGHQAPLLAVAMASHSTTYWPSSTYHLLSNFSFMLSS